MPRTAVHGIRLDGIDEVRAGEICRAILRRWPLRLFCAGRAGAGKDTVAHLIAGNEFPVLGHADTLKEEVLAWLADVVTKTLYADDEGMFGHFCDFMGFDDPAIVRTDLAELLMPLSEAFGAMAKAAVHEHGLTRELAFFASLATGEFLEAKVAYCNRYRGLFRLSLQRYSQAVKELCANPSHWVERTIARAQDHPICCNADTRFAEDEVDLLRFAGWKGIYLWIDRPTQRRRRPELTEEQIHHVSESSIRPEDCDLVVDGRLPIATVMTTVARWLVDPTGVADFVPPAEDGFDR
jgi:hypothetical protein